jgi:hypothetical protein
MEMDDSDKTALRAGEQAFNDSPRPQRMVRDPSHCPECAEANEFLLELGPSDIGHFTIGKGAGFGYFSLASPEAFRYFLPSLCRMAIEEESLTELLSRLSGMAEHLSVTHRQAVSAFLDYSLGRVEYDRERHAEIEEIQEQLRNSPVTLECSAEA